MLDKNKETEIIEVEPKLYELGYLLSPVVEAEKVEEVVAKEIEALIAKVGGEITSQMKAEKQVLAYSVSITREHKKQTFSEAYFGAIRFKADPAIIEDLNQKIKALDLVLRFILISVVVKTKAVVPPKVEALPKEEIPESTPEEKPEETPVEENAPASEAEIDKEIEDLLTSKV